MGNPPPLPINSGAPSNSGIFRQAATLSLVIPTLIGVASRFSLELSKAHPGPTGQLIMLGAAAVSSITIFIGLALGIAAATGASGKGEGRVRVRGAAGILINSVLLAVFVTGFVKGYTKIQPSARALSEVQQLLKTAQAKEAQNVEKGDGVTMAKLGNDTLDQVKGKIDVAAREGSGSTRTTLEAASAYLEKLQTLTKDYESRLAALQKIDAVNPANLIDRSELAPRRLTIRAFLDSNERLKKFMEHAEEQSSHRLLFQDEKALKRFDTLNQGLSEAAEEQKNLQRRLTQIPAI